MKHLTHILAVAMALLVAACSGEEENEYYPAKPGSLTLRLSTTNVMFPSTDASAEISVESNSRWTVADTGDNSWLTITYTSEPKGTANGTFTITAADNLSGAQRTTTVTVTSAEKSESITVTQSATSMAVDPTQLAVFSAEGGSETLHILSSTKWSATTVADWISITPSTGDASDEIADVTVTIAPTTLETQRTSEILVECPDDPTIEPVHIAVSQRGLDPEKTWFEVNPTTIAPFDYGGGKADINVRSSAPWTVHTVASWLSFTPASDLGGDKVVSISIAAAANPDELERTADIIVESSDREFDPVTISVSQAAKPAAPKYFEVSPTAVPEIGHAGGSFNVTVRSSSACKVSSIADWIDFKGSENLPASDKPVTFKVTVKANPDEVVRESTLTIKSENSEFKPISISIRQQAKPAAPKYFEVSPTAVPEIGHAGDSFNVTVRSSSACKVSSIADWIDFKGSENIPASDKPVTFKVTVKANPDEVVRESTLTIKSENTAFEPVSISIRQQAKPAAPLFFEVNPTSLPVMQAAGGTATVSVRCNAAWNVATAANWLTLSTTSGVGGETAQNITVTASANEYATAREATLTFTSSDRRSQPITVTLKQAAADAPTVGELSATGISTNSATLSCALNAPTHITEKGVMYRAAGSGADWTKVADTSAATDRITATVTGLRPGTRYEAKAYCRATSGQAETAVITFRTSGTTPGADDNTPPNR